MTNGLIFFITTLIALFLVLLMLRLGRQGLVAVIVTNIILVSSFGALLIPLFGLSTNAGNVFYAAIFLAAQVITEHYERRTAYRSVWIGFGALVLFVLMAQYAIRLTPVPGSESLSASMHAVFEVVPRIALASMAAYIVSQTVNVWLFATLRQKTGKKQLWLRSLLSSGVGQLIDSLLFFTIAFAGTVSSQQLIQAMLTGFGVKMLVAILGIPVLYLSYVMVRMGGSSVRDTSED